jgi:hypothetical protein
MSIIEVQADSLIVFVDETGHEELADSRFPVFGLGGCALPSSLYVQNVKRPWIYLKKTHFGDVTKLLHASEAHKYSAAQKEAIGEFFRKQCFGRFAVVVKQTTKFPEELFRYQIVVGLLEERLRPFAAANEFESVTIILESSKRTDSLAEKYFSKIDLRNNRSRQIPINCYLMGKSCREPGLEVADFVINAAGGRARSRISGDERPRKDFQSIFQEVKREFVSFVELDSVRFTESRIYE